MNSLEEKLYSCESLSVELAQEALQQIQELKKELEKTKAIIELYQRERERFRHSKPEITGEYFIAGGYGEVDENLLPQFIRICPAYGANWEQVYQKTDKIISYEGS
jgi:hypothetical protein